MISKKGKRLLSLSEKINKEKSYNIDDAIKLLKETATAKFDETIEAHVRLGINAKNTDQQIRSTVIMPNGIGKVRKIVVFAKGEKEKEALDAGGDYVGLNDLVEKIQKGWMDFSSVIATPDTMSIVSKLGKILGPRGLMPNPKVGTVTQDIAKAIKDIKLGKIEIRLDKCGIIHIGFAKASFDNNKIKENLNALILAIINVKPNSIKGAYIKSIFIKSTMGPSIRVDSSTF